MKPLGPARWASRHSFKPYRISIGTISTPRYRRIAGNAAKASPSQRNAILPAARALRVAFNLKSAQFLQKTNQAKRDLPTWRLRAAPISTRAPRKIARGNAYERPATPPKRPCCWKRDGGCLGQPSIRTSCDAAAIRFLTPRVHREHPLREPERPTRRWAAAALAQRMWRRCAASEDAVEMIMAYYGAAPDDPSSPLATATSC